MFPLTLLSEKGSLRVLQVVTCSRLSTLDASGREVNKNKMFHLMLLEKKGFCKGTFALRYYQELSSSSPQELELVPDDDAVFMKTQS